MHHAQLTEIARPGQAAFDQTVGTLQNGLGVSHAQALTLVDRMVNTQAFTMSAVDVFYGSAVIFLLLTGLVWFARPKSAKAGGGAAEAAAEPTRPGEPPWRPPGMNRPALEAGLLRMRADAAGFPSTTRARVTRFRRFRCARRHRA